MNQGFAIRRVGADEVEALVEPLADVLIDCVEGGASVSFMWPLPRERALSFWRDVADGVRRGERLLLVAQAQTGHIDGTVQLVLAPGPFSRGPSAPRPRSASVCWCSTPSRAAMRSACTSAAAGSVSA